MSSAIHIRTSLYTIKNIRLYIHDILNLIIYREGVSLIKKNLMLSFKIEEEISLLPFLLKVIKDRGRNATKSILRRGQVMVNGKIITQHNHLLMPEDEVDILTNKGARKFSYLTGIQIIYEDDSIIVANKDAGLLTMASNRKNEPTAYRQLTDYVKFDNPKNRIFIVHRLDRATSGIMIFAKTKNVQEKLQNNWQKVVKKRMYTAVVEGHVQKEMGTIISWLKETKTHHVYSSSTDNGGKKAVSHFRKLDGNINYSLLEVELETGRKNQVRVHMQEIKHSIVGDSKYGAKTNPLRRLGLHATTLEFIHPISGKIVSYTVKPPVSFNKLTKK